MVRNKITSIRINQRLYDSILKNLSDREKQDRFLNHINFSDLIENLLIKYCKENNINY